MKLRNDGRWSLGVGLGLFLLAITISSLLVISVCQQNAYIWLGIVLVSIIFLTTFTCTTQVPILWAQETDSRDPSVIETETVHNLPPYWIRVSDLPPSYSVATAHHFMNVRVENTDPPPYTNVILQPPNIPYGHCNPAFNYNEVGPDTLQRVTTQGSGEGKRCGGQTYLCERCHHETLSSPQSVAEKLTNLDDQPSGKNSKNSSNIDNPTAGVLPPDRRPNLDVEMPKEESLATRDA